MIISQLVNACGQAARQLSGLASRKLPTHGHASILCLVDAAGSRGPALVKLTGLKPVACLTSYGVQPRHMSKVASTGNIEELTALPVYGRQSDIVFCLDWLCVLC